MVRYGLDSDTSSDFASALLDWEVFSQGESDHVNQVCWTTLEVYDEADYQLVYRNSTLLIVIRTDQLVQAVYIDITASGVQIYFTARQSRTHATSIGGPLFMLSL
jgi:hypothetical protein